MMPRTFKPGTLARTVAEEQLVKFAEGAIGRLNENRILAGDNFYSKNLAELCAALCELTAKGLGMMAERCRAKKDSVEIFYAFSHGQVQLMDRDTFDTAGGQAAGVHRYAS